MSSRSGVAVFIEKNDALTESPVLGTRRFTPIKDINSQDLESEFYHAQKVCKRCKIYYTEAHRSKCRFHPGTFVDFSRSTKQQSANAEVALEGWSCCRRRTDNSVNEEALSRNAKGCKIADTHDEDMAYSSAIAHFPFNATAAATSGSPSARRVGLRTSASASSAASASPALQRSASGSPLSAAPAAAGRAAASVAPIPINLIDDSPLETPLLSASGETPFDAADAAEPDPPGQSQPDDAAQRQAWPQQHQQQQQQYEIVTVKGSPYVKHRVEPSDTLAGLALRYGTSIAELKKANRIPAVKQDIFPLKHLLVPVVIPPTEEELARRETLEQFRSRAASAGEQASVFLAATNWDLQLALRQWQLRKLYVADPGTPVPDDGAHDGEK